MDNRWMMAPREGPNETGRGDARNERQDAGREDPGKGRRTARWLLAALIGIVVVAVAGALLLSLMRHRRESRETQARAASAAQGPQVLVAKVQTSAGTREATLPGEMRAFYVVQIV